jgi:hypothetical protein
MEKQGIWSLDKQRRYDGIFVLVLLLFGLGFFLPNAHFQLASDDVGWLRGEAPTVFDQYRYIPRILFVLLYTLFGLSPVAALVMIFFFHFANSLLVGRLCQKLLNSQLAARVSALVFLVNPITHSTLTWFSCFSYVQGTTLALMSLLAFLKSSAKGIEKRLFWSIIALICYGAGLFCSHELFFLPGLFLLFGWQFSRKVSKDNPNSWLWGGASHKQGAILFAVAMALAMLVNFLVYDFGRYGIGTIKLFSFGFVSAFASSALSFGLSLGLAYPLSFFAKTLGFLRICFSEPLRWGMTLVLLAGGILLYKPNRTWRLRLVLALSFIALITPYIIRLYLMPGQVNYHISYVLSGRVFYLPFTIIALIWGGIVAKLYEDHVTQRKLAWLLPILYVAAYSHALLALYDRTDFMGLEVLHGSSQSFPPAWTPYAHNQPVWSVGSALVIIAMVAIRFVAEKVERIRGASHEATSP